MPKFKKDVKFHEELRQCVLSTYNEKKFPIPEGYQVLERVENPKSGYYGLVLKKDNDIIIASKGTDLPEEGNRFIKTGQLSSFKDMRNNISMGMKHLPAQSYDIQKLYGKYKEKGRVVLTGDSLGGSCSVIVGSQTGADTVVFNPYGVEDILKNNDKTYNSDNIINYCNKLDGITTMNSENHIGDVYEMKSTSQGAGFHDHFLENQKTVTEQTPITPEELKRKEGVEAVQNKAKTGIQTVSKMQHDMDVNNRDIFNQLFKNFLNLYESPTENSKFNNKTFGGYRNNNGNGEIYVREYKRADGTTVRAHWRSYSGNFDPNKRLSEMQGEELNNAIDFWMDEDKFV